MFPRIFLVTLTMLIGSMAHAETAFRQLTLQKESDRPLNVALWYPTRQSGMPASVGDNSVFIGTQALRDAKPAPGNYPLLLLSHGYGGSWRNLNWLAQRMAEQGYIVAAVDHPGTTTHNKKPKDAQQLWQRPQDLRRTLDALLATPAFAGEIDKGRIAAVGHSLGGWTVLELAGGRFAADRFIADCQNHPDLSSCTLIHTLGIDRPSAAEHLAEDVRDPRIKAVVSLDLGLARGFTPESLKQISIPVLIMAAQADSDALPARLESGHLAEFIPAAWQRYIRVEGATHFSFMQLCKPGAAALIEQDAPGEGIVCQDGGTVSRSDIHQHLADKIGAFLHQALALPALNDDTRLGSSR
ncbi:alpha/beta fold hydrolase [Pseudescherichia vulneris]|uniref:alpha/beta hydrolase family protein n=1 Tax=Pseudescherichia vulneris TaxID=566 RepID=UPI0028D184AE|nr:alpha/beta fold hydrolase [Pseudescherichia vulneris]